MVEMKWKNGMEEWNGRKTEETSRCECLGFQDVANAVGRQEVVRLKLTANLSKKGVCRQKLVGTLVVDNFLFFLDKIDRLLLLKVPNDRSFMFITVTCRL